MEVDRFCSVDIASSVASPWLREAIFPPIDGASHYALVSQAEAVSCESLGAKGGRRGLNVRNVTNGGVMI
jgi:hypothetical protein